MLTLHQFHSLEQIWQQFCRPFLASCYGPYTVSKNWTWEFGGNYVIILIISHIFH